MDLDFEDFDIIPEERKPIEIDREDAWENEEEDFDDSNKNIFIFSSIS